MYLELVRDILKLSFSEFKVKYKSYEFVECDYTNYCKIAKLTVNNADFLCLFKNTCVMCIAIVEEDFISKTLLTKTLNEKFDSQIICDKFYWIHEDILINIEKYNEKNHLIFTNNEYI